MGSYGRSLPWGRIAYLLGLALSAAVVANKVGIFVSDTCILCSKAIFTMYGANVCAFGVHSFFSDPFSDPLSASSLLVLLVQRCMVCYKPEPGIH